MSVASLRSIRSRRFSCPLGANESADATGNPTGQPVLRRGGQALERGSLVLASNLPFTQWAGAIAPKAKAFFATISASNRYAVLWRVQTAIKPETRARRIAKLVEMLRQGEVVHIFRPKAKDKASD